MSVYRRLWVGALVWAAWAQAQAPPAPLPPPPRAPPAAPAPPAQPPAPKAGDPDESLLEFLGSDDEAGDPAWWEFLKRHPRAGNGAPPPDGKQ